MAMEQRTVNLEIRNSNLEERKISGYAAVFGEEFTQLKTRYGETFFEKISTGAFTKTLADESRKKFMLVNHDWNKVVGRSGVNLILTEDEKGLRFDLDVPATTEGNDLLENVRLGLIDGCSFGFNIVKQTTRWDDDWNFYRDITEVDLFEVTATPLPAYTDTEISARSELSIKDLRAEAEQKPQATNEEPKVNTNKRSADVMLAFFNAFN